MREKKNDILSAVSSFHLEADRASSGMRMRVGGVIGIADYSAERVCLKSHGARVLVTGKRLSVSVYEDKVTEITGRVEEVSFFYGKN